MNTETEINALIRTSETTAEEADAAPLVVTKRGAVIKNRHGKTAPENRLCCNLKKMTLTSEAVKLYFPDGECCDMDGAIVLATCASPSITLIQTWSGEKQDTTYVKTGDSWKGLLAV